MRLLISVLLISLSSAYAQEISPTKLLRKAKMRILKSDPTAAEYNKLIRDYNEKCLDSKKNECLHDLLKGYVQGYLKNRMHTLNIQNMVRELLAFKNFDNPFKSEYSSDSYGDSPNDTISSLIKNIIEKNMSWDAFFTHNEYEVIFSSYSNYDSEDYFSRYVEKVKTDTGIIEAIKQTQTGSYQKTEVVKKVKIEDEDLAAGFITTDRFNSRYWSNSINQGRGKSSAIIKVGLCDDMIPAVDLTDAGRKKELSISLDQMVHSGDVSTEALHGTQKDCMACHYDRGLDPLAETLHGTYQTLSKKPFPGALVYTNSNRKIVDIPVRGIGHYTKELVNLPKYKKCQTKRFWDLYTGNIQASQNESFQEKLVQKYDELGGRVNDFIEFIVLENIKMELGIEKDFKVKELTPFDKVKPILKNCDSCHGGSITVSFTKFPVMNHRGDDISKIVLGMISGHLDLFNSEEVGLNRVMPPSNSDWQPTKEDLNKIKTWIEDGAEYEGEKYLKEIQIQEIKGRK